MDRRSARLLVGISILGILTELRMPLVADPLTEELEALQSDHRPASFRLIAPTSSTPAGNSQGPPLLVRLARRIYALINKMIDPQPTSSLDCEPENRSPAPVPPVPYPALLSAPQGDAKRVSQDECPHVLREWDCAAMQNMRSGRRQPFAETIKCTMSSA
jgi:hypothetical protein